MMEDDDVASSSFASESGVYMAPPASQSDHRVYVQQRPVGMGFVKRPTFSPYQNQPILTAAAKKRYVIGTPRPGVKSKQFPGLEHLHQIRKQVAEERRVTVVPPLDNVSPNTLLLTHPVRNSKTRYVLKIPKRDPIIRQPQLPMIKHNASDSVRWNVNPAITYNCPDHECFWKGATSAALAKHLSQRHPEISVPSMSHPLPKARSAGVRCSECDSVVYSRSLLLKHMGTVHGISIPPFSRTFINEKELTDWLCNISDSFAVEFVTVSGAKQWSNGARITYLLCKHSGDKKERPNKKFSRPPRPTIKSGKTCTAYLKMRHFEGEDQNSPLMVEGCLYHTGHNINPRRLRLTGEEMDAVYRLAERQQHSAMCWDAHAIRNELGVNAARFRLIDDESLSEIVPEWCKTAMDIGWKYKMGQTTDADLLSQTVVMPIPTLPAPSAYQPSTQYNDYTLLDEEILHYDSDQNASEGEGSINVTDDLIKM